MRGLRSRKSDTVWHVSIQRRMIDFLGTALFAAVSLAKCALLWPRPIARAGRWRSSVAVGAAGPGPDEGVAVAVLVIEEVGVDRGGEARIVELEPEIGAALVRSLGPGGPDLGAADEDPVGGSVFGGAAGVGDDADGLGLDAEGDDFAGIFGAGLLEGADGSHVVSPDCCCFEPAPIATSMVIARAGTSADAAGTARSIAQDGAAGAFLDPPGSSARNGRRPGEESSGGAVAAKAIEASADPGQINTSRGPRAGGFRDDTPIGRLATVGSPVQVRRLDRRKKRSPVVQTRRIALRRIAALRMPPATGSTPEAVTLLGTPRP